MIIILSKQMTIFDTNNLHEIVLANSPRDMGSIPGRVIPKTFKMILDTTLL